MLEGDPTEVTIEELVALDELEARAGVAQGTASA